LDKASIALNVNKKVVMILKYKVMKQQQLLNNNIQIDGALFIEYSGFRSAFVNSHRYGIKYFRKIIRWWNSDPYIKTLQCYPERDLIIKSHLKGKMDALEALKRVDDFLINLIKQEEKIDIELFSYLGRNDIFPIVEQIADRLSDKDYWTLIGECFTNSDFAHEEYEFIKSFLLADRPCQEFLMNEEERDFFKALPEKVTIYRGCSLAEIKSKKFRFSWTLDKKVAEFFAFEYRRNNSIECGIVKKIVPKSKLIAYFNGSEESEVIYVS